MLNTYMFRAARNVKSGIYTREYHQTVRALGISTIFSLSVRITDCNFYRHYPTKSNPFNGVH